MIKYIRPILACLLTLSFLAGEASYTAAYQGSPESTYVSELTGAILDIGDSGQATLDLENPWFEEYSNGTLEEGIFIDMGNTEIAVLFIATDVSNDQIMQDYIDAEKDDRYLRHAVLTQQDDLDRAWYVVEYSQYFGHSYYGYHQFEWEFGANYTLLIQTYGHQDNLIDDITWVQKNVTVDDAPIYVDADLMEIEKAIDGTSDLNGYVVDTFTSDVDDWTDQGLVSDDEWHGDLIGNEFTWSGDSLRFPFESRAAIQYLEPNESSTLTLTTTSHNGNILITELTSDEARTAEDWSDRWASEGLLSATGNIYPPLDVTGTESETGLLILKKPRYGLELVTIRQGILMPGDGIVMVTIVASAEDAPAVYAAMTGELRIDGESITPLWSDGELAEAFSGENPTADGDGDVTTRADRSSQSDDTDDAEEEPAERPGRSSRSSGTTATAEASTPDWENMGLVSDSEWQSPVSGTSFTWDTSTFMFPADESGAITSDGEFATVQLYTTDGRGEVSLNTDIGGYPIDSWYEAMRSEEWAATQAADSLPITLLDHYTDGTTASVIFVHHSADGDFVVIIDVYENDDGITILTEITAAPEDISAVYKALWNGVQADGEYYPLTWTIEDIENLQVDWPEGHLEPGT